MVKSRRLLLALFLVLCASAGRISAEDRSGSRPPKPVVTTLDTSAYCAALAPAGKLLALGTGEEIELWDPATRKTRGKIAAECSALAFSPDGKVLVSSRGKQITFWDPVGRKSLRQLQREKAGHLEALAFSPDGKRLAWAVNLALGLIDVGTGRELFQVQLPRDRRLWRVPLALAFSPDGKILATASHSDDKVRLWDTSTGKEMCPNTVRCSEENYALAFAPDGQTLVSAGRNGLQVWRVEDGKLQRPFRRPRPEEIASAPRFRGYHGQLGAHASSAEWRVHGVAFSPDGRTLVAVGYELNDFGSVRAQIQILDAVTGELRRQYHVGEHVISYPPAPCIAFDMDHTFIFADLDGDLFVNLSEPAKPGK